MIKPSKSKSRKPPAANPAQKPAPESSVKQALLGWYGVIGMTLGYVSPIKLPWVDSYAKDYWRHALGSLMLMLGLLATAIGTALYLLDANDFKAQIVDYVKTHKQRELVLEGDIHLTWFPQLGLETGKLSLSQRNSARKFASVNNARLYVAWWPLLTKRVQVERVVLDGVHANLVRHRDGSTNFDDLLTPVNWMGQTEFAVEKVRVLDSSLNLQDEASGRAVFVHELNLETGRLADATAGQLNTRFRLQAMQPQLDLQLRLDGQLLYDHANHRYQLADMQGQAQGEAGGFSELALDWRGSLTAWPTTQKLLLEQVNVTGRGRYDGHKLEGRLAAARAELEPEQWQASALSLGATLQREPAAGGSLLSAALELPAVEAKAGVWRSADVRASLELQHAGGTLQAHLSSPLQYDPGQRQLQLEGIAGDWNASHPLLAARLNATLSGKLQAALAKQELALEFKAGVDDSQFSGKVGLQDYKTPAWTFDVVASTLDLDRYLVGDWTRRLQDSTQVQDFDLLKTLNVRGKLRADELRVAHLKASQFAAELRAGSGTMSVEPLAAQFYGGSLQGGLSLTAGEAPQLSVRQKLTGVQVDTLLADLSGGEARLSGKGNVAFDLTAQGASLEALRQSLTGTASLALTRGALAGLDLADGLVVAKEQLGLEGAEHKDNIRLTENTPFAELKASWELAQGQARSVDLLLKSPTLTCKGEARLALGSGQLDAQLSTLVTPGLKRAGAGELAELAGITVPLQISGPWATAGVRYELGAASGGTLARLAKANQARVAAATAASTPAPTPVAPASAAAAAPATTAAVVPAKTAPAAATTAAVKPAPVTKTVAATTTSAKKPAPK
jgi:AsmA protein